MAEQLDQTAPETSEREQILRDFGKDFSDGKLLSDVADKPEKVDSKPDDTATADGKPQADSRQRDQTGKFVKQEKPEPFEGFKDLDPKIQAQFEAITKERDRLKGDYSAVAGRLPGVQREVEQLRARLAQPNQTPKQQQQSQIKLDELLQSEKWKNFASRYPEDADGIRDALQTTADNLVSRFSDSANPLAQEVQQLKARLGELDTREQVKAAQHTTDRLTELHPEWRQIAGWEDSNGNYIADPAQRDWHPWFKAWREALPPLMQNNYDQLLGTLDAENISYVLSHFKRDVQEAMGTQQETAAPQGDELAQRRADALRDTSPRPSRPGAEPPQNPFEKRSNDDAERKAVLDRYYDSWKTGKAGQRL